MWRKGNPPALLVGMEITAATIDNSMDIPQNTKNRSGNSTPGYISEKKKPKMVIQKDTCTPASTEALFAIAKIWKQTKGPSTDEWIKTKWYTYQME